MSSAPSKEPTDVEKTKLPEPTWWQKNRRAIFEISKIMQICICMFFVVAGIIMATYNLLSPHDRTYWYYWPFWGRHYRFKCSEDNSCSLWKDLVYYYFFYGFWVVVIASICGMIGAAGEIVSFQVIYAILCTFWLTLFAWMPWMIFVGIVGEWSVPYYERWGADYAVQH